MNYPPVNAAFVSTLKDSKLSYVSRYVLSHDYRKLLHNRLEKLGEMIQQYCASLSFRLSVGSTPILGRPLAEKTELGWTGKHSLILNREASSFFFLGELLVDTPLLVDQPAEGGYSKYAACMMICLTDAIAKSHTVDARHCISYLTIELRRAIPEELRPLVGNRIYGCDNCQPTCPWNRYSQFTTEEDLSPRKPLHAPGPIELFAWSEERFLKVTKGSVTRRIGHLRQLCSIAVVLGSVPQDETILIAPESCKDEHPLPDEYIAQAITQ